MIKESVSKALASHSTSVAYVEGMGKRKHGSFVVVHLKNLQIGGLREVGMA